MFNSYTTQQTILENNKVKYSNDKSDAWLQENTSDFKRFSTIENLEKWYKDTWRIVFSIITSDWKIAWFYQARPSKLPLLKEIENQDLYKTISENKSNIHTSWVRLYPEHRWKWLAWPLLKLSHKYYWKINPEFILSIDIEENNIPSRKSFEKAWFKLLWRWENQKTVDSSVKPRVVYALINDN